MSGPAARVRLCPLAPAHLIGLGALQAAAVLLFFEPWWALWPLGGFVVLMGVAAFFPNWRLFMPVVSRGRLPSAVGLTFDDGPDPATTPELLDLLERHGARATFFLVGRQAVAHPDLVRRIMAAGHEIGNHTQDHDVLLALRPRRRVRRTIAACQRSLAECGARPRVFRPPAWVVNPGLWRVLLENDLICVTASRRGLDFGNRRLEGLAGRVLSRVRGGDLIALHDRAPSAPGGVDAWLAEVERVLEGLAARGLEVASLSAQLGRPVMDAAPADPAAGLGAVRWFYDGLAADYDAEQAGRGQGGVRAAERDRILAGIDALAPPGARILEVGAGTGRFTLALAKRAAQVVAVDLSPAMLAVLDAKAGAAGLTRIQTRVGDLHQLALHPQEGQPGFDLVCSFSVLEYAPDLAAAVAGMARNLRPGGWLWLTTAHAGLPRLIGQIGNAIRQGVWLHARTAGGVRRALTRAGLGAIQVRPFGPAGLLIEARAQAPESPAVAGPGA